MAENLLLLTPKSFAEIPLDSAALVELLRQERFIADTVEINGEQHFMPGEEFMMLITFLGCSPMIATGAMESGGEQYCHIAFEGPLEQPHFIAGDNVKVPRCPHCGHRHDDWPALVAAWEKAPFSTILCPACGDEHAVTRLRWRKCAGFGRYFIKIWGIFESEAVPSPNLLASLKQASGVEWLHFYVRNS